MPISDTDAAGSMLCEDCSRRFYVIDEPACCPYCGGGSVSPGYPVAIRPK